MEKHPEPAPGGGGCSGSCFGSLGPEPNSHKNEIRALPQSEHLTCAWHGARPWGQVEEVGELTPNHRSPCLWGTYKVDSHLILTTLSDQCSYYPQVTDPENEVQRRKVICLRSHS